MSEEFKAKELRIVLDGPATEAYETMVSRMKEAVSTIKVQPSHFASFLMVDYLDAHFEKDKAVLIAEFFDSDAFHEAERKVAKGKPDYEELMQAALNCARQIKGKKRRKAVRKGRQALKDNESSAP
jgi:hypothetical protein